MRASNAEKVADSAIAKVENAGKEEVNALIDPQDVKAVEAEASDLATVDPDGMAAEEAENASEDMEAVEAEVTVVETEATDRKDAKVAAARTGDKTEVGIRVKPHPTFKEIYNITLEDGAKRLGTKNLTVGRSVYNERLIKFKGEEYRVWDAFRSKLAGAIIKGLQTVPIEAGSKVLYLGAASGTTPSHISDIVGETGQVYCIEFAQRSLRDLMNNVAQFRSNIIPLLEDARMPEHYAMFISGKVDVIYCDVAQPEQAKLLADNADCFLKQGGWLMLACKSQSIDVTMAPQDVYKQEAGILRKRGYDVKEIIELDPYDIAHAMIVAQKI